MTSPTRSGCARRERFEPQPPDPESGGGRKASVVPVREEPEDAGRREILKAELTKILSQDQAFKAEVQALVEQAQAAGVVRVTASGDAGVVAGGNVTQWAGGNIVTGHNIGGDQVGGDKITHVYNGPTYVYEGPAYPRLTYQNEAGPLVAFYTKLRSSSGRKPELDRLVDFAAQPTPGYMLVEAPPAFGKSALAAQLIHRHETGQWPRPPPALVYFFIRQDGKWHTPDLFCSVVNSQLLDLLDERGGVPPDLQSRD